MQSTTDRRFDLVRDCAGSVANSSVDDGIAAVCQRVSAFLGAASVTYSKAGERTGEHDDSSLGAPEVWQQAVSALGRRVGELRIRRPAPLDATEVETVEAIADVLAGVVARDQRVLELEAEISARVAEIAEQRAFIECVVDSLPVGLHVVDQHYRIHAWNHKRETGLQGVPRTDAIGRTIFEVLNRQPAAMMKQEFDEVFATGRLQQFQMESNAFGDTRAFRISKIPMRMGGNDVTHVITIGEDITDWKAAIDRTAQSEKLAALGQLAAGVMHEINNPLATIAACAETLALQDVASAGELLRIIDLEVQRCKRIVNGLLDFSRPKPASREPLDINGVVQQGMFLLQHHPRYKRVRMIEELELATPLYVEGDADQLVQVLIALVINAMDASPEGGRVTVRTRYEAPIGSGTAHALLEVVDEGPGIPRALQGKVFEPFFTTKAQGEGTGLGLAICYGIVTDHGGHLELVPSDSGTLFRVALPESPVMSARSPVQPPTTSAGVAS
ncbi:MAG TPA: ATP-binding protein [Gemmatimonas sp.]|nr:ATP-binding protein [Gemmatimonas sp.]